MGGGGLEGFGGGGVRVIVRVNDDRAKLPREAGRRYDRAMDRLEEAKGSVKGFRCVSRSDIR